MLNRIALFKATKPVPNFTRLDPSRPEIAVLMAAMLRAGEVVAAPLVPRKCRGHGSPANRSQTAYAARWGVIGQGIIFVRNTPLPRQVYQNTIAAAHVYQREGIGGLSGGPT